MRIILADDHKIIREGLHSLLVKSGHEVVAEAKDDRTIVRLAKEMSPEGKMLDSAMKNR